MIVFSTPVELSSERTSEETKNKRMQTREEDEKPLRLKKEQEQIEKITVAEDDDEKKTLAQQVLDGKYGLIQTELFSSPVKRPGILSYEVNPEVPKDNINNLGGLKPEEIWLAENHLLVLKGGGFSEKEQTGKVIWPPIDNYIAPQRQVKIPPNPKVPPPFPIQLKDGGPIEVIQGKNNTKPPPYFNGPFGPPFLFPLTPNGRKEEDSTQGQGNSTLGNGGGIPFPYLPPGAGLYPPAIAFLPPPGNLTELDEDDPRIYYPPKYDFVYKRNYSSHVPPGPLVPGIILPPPPDFFAPLDNGTKTQRPSGNTKPSLSQKKLSKPRLPLLNVVRQKVTPHLNIQKPKSSHVSRQHKLISPIRVVSNSGQYEQPYKSKPNKSNDEWVPIPAPRPFYITEINKLRAIANNKYSDQSLKYERPKNGWDYDSTTTAGISTKAPENSFMNGYLNSGLQDTRKDTYYTTETNENNLVSSTPPPKTASNYEAYEPSPLIEDEKQKHINFNAPIIRGKFLNPPLQESPPRYIEQYVYNKPYVEINTLIPQRVYEDVTIKTPSLSGRLRLPQIKYEEDYKNTVNPPTSKPLSYLYYEQESKYQSDDGGYRYDVPLSSVDESNRPEQFRVFPTRENTKQQVNTYSSTTAKPPVYEYSYSAPGYGTVEAPKVGNNIETTPKPVLYETDFKEPQLEYFDYQSPSKQNEYRSGQTTLQPSYSTTRPPSRPKAKYVKADPYQTENPYLSYNTQEIGLLDDITKKYFTLFGQKINQDEGKEIVTTTSLPQTNQNYYEKPYYQNYEGVAPGPTKTPSTHVRFPELYNIQSDKSYYQNPPEYSTTKYRISNKNPKANIDQNDNYSYYYPHASGGLRGYKQQYNQGVVRPNHPLDSDVDVNYKLPNLPINPDAEYINPAYLNPVSLNGNSYVSYRLPGNSGHFYFLTPQSIRQQSYPIQNPRLRYQDIEKRGYIPREVRNKVLK